jgi:broad-specificity NMP kinase
MEAVGLSKLWRVLGMVMEKRHIIGSLSATLVDKVSAVVILSVGARRLAACLKWI